MPDDHSRPVFDKSKLPSRHITVGTDDGCVQFPAHRKTRRRINCDHKPAPRDHERVHNLHALSFQQQRQPANQKMV